MQKMLTLLQNENKINYRKESIDMCQKIKTLKDFNYDY